MACCATSDCGNPECQVCTVNDRFVILACGKDVKGKPCRMVEGHRGNCLETMRAGRKEEAELKDSKPVPDMSGDRAAATSLAFQKRHREGAFRQQRA